MIEIITPSNLSPFDRPAVFRFTGQAADAGAAIDALLEDADTGAVLAARRIRLDGSAAAEFDAAPVLRRAMMLQPAGGATGLAGAADAMFRVRMTAGGVQSERVTLICTAPARNALTLMSQMPGKRHIRYGESDVLTFYAMSDFSVRIEVRTGTTASSHRYDWTGDAGLVALRLRTSDFDSAAESIGVYVNNALMAEYEVEPAAGEALRIAWRNGSGIIEHYTFALVARSTAAAERRSVRLTDGVCTVAAQWHEQLQLASQYEPAAVVDALAGIAVSPQVWAVDGQTGAYVSVGVVTGEVVTRRQGEPSNVGLTVRPSQNGVRL